MGSRSVAGVNVVRVVLASLAGIVTFVLLFAYWAIAPIIMVPVIAGAIVWLIARDDTTGLIAGVAAGFLGSAAASVVFSVRSLTSALQAMPPYANVDVTGSLYTATIIPMLQANPVVSGGSTGWVLVVLAGTLVTPLVVLGLNRLPHIVPTGRDVRRLVGWATIGVVALGFVATAWPATEPLRDLVRTEPADGEYAIDYMINVRTVHRMADGDPYYDAYFYSASHDVRLINEDAFDETGFTTNWGSPFLIRQPWMFWIWRVTALFGGVGSVVTFSMMAAASVLVLAYWAFRDHVGEGAVFLGVVLYPVMLLSTVWLNVFQHDWWTALAVLASVFALSRKQLVVAMCFALLATLMREVMVVWLVILTVGAFMAARKDASARKAVVAGAILLAIFGVALFVHYGAAQSIISDAATGTDGGAFLVKNMGRPLEVKVLPATSYMMFPYGMFSFPAAVFLPLGIVGLWYALRRDRWLAWLAASLPAFWLVFYLVVGPSSSYWGQHVMPLALIGTALLLVSPAHD
ncbi:MAG: hypothetical protein Q7W44_09685 [Coriobacteriia bacterium]|nr:hypothetical protein [Coriobacteriia bacterium]